MWVVLDPVQTLLVDSQDVRQFVLVELLYTICNFGNIACCAAYLAYEVAIFSALVCSHYSCEQRGAGPSNEDTRTGQNSHLKR